MREKAAKKAHKKDQEEEVEEGNEARRELDEGVVETIANVAKSACGPAEACGGETGEGLLCELRTFRARLGAAPAEQKKGLIESHAAQMKARAAASGQDLRKLMEEAMHRLYRAYCSSGARDVTDEVCLDQSVSKLHNNKPHEEGAQ